MMSHRLLPAALLLCTLIAACAELPTRGDTRAHPAGASYDGGYTIGSGNRAEDEDAPLTTTSTTTSGDSTARGGYGMGSGN
ncbi:MAG: hypothetical protein KY467_12430 [Gemmatimonadetes bacterium]|nr:hypothetical protein [Gemmatimonadota bacterium]